MAGEEDTIVVDTAPEVETQAREMGWRPKDEFKGDEGKWVDATTFVERGEHVLPIIKKTNERLRTDLSATNTRLNEMTAALEQSQKTIQALEKYHQDDVKQKVERARADIKEQLKVAKKAGDVDAEVDLTEELGRLNQADTAAAARAEDDTTTVTTKAAPKDYTNDPVFVAWKEEQSWFGVDRARTAIAYDIQSQLRASGDKSTGREHLDKIADGVQKELKRLGVAPARTTSKVEGGKGGAGGGGGSGAKTWSDLPADAKAACTGFERDLVGAGKLYKDQAAWRAKYTEDYFKDV